MGVSVIFLREEPGQRQARPLDRRGEPLRSRVRAGLAPALLSACPKMSQTGWSKGTVRHRDVVLGPPSVHGDYFASRWHIIGVFVKTNGSSGLVMMGPPGV